MEFIEESIKQDALKQLEVEELPDNEIADALIRKLCETADLQFGVLEFRDEAMADVSRGFQLSSKWGFGSFYEMTFKSSAPGMRRQNCEMGVVLKHAKRSNKLLFKVMTEDGRNITVCVFERAYDGNFRFVSGRKNFASENILIEILTKILENWNRIYGALWARVMINWHMDLPEEQRREEAAFWRGLENFMKSDRFRSAAGAASGG